MAPLNFEPYEVMHAWKWRYFFASNPRLNLHVKIRTLLRNDWLILNFSSKQSEAVKIRTFLRRQLKLGMMMRKAAISNCYLAREWCFEFERLSWITIFSYRKYKIKTTKRLKKKKRKFVLCDCANVQYFHKEFWFGRGRR